MLREVVAVGVLIVLGGVLALGLVAYLCYALLRPEKF